MIGRKDMKQETMAKRVRNKAVANKMMSPRKKMDMGMSPGPDMGAASAPPMGFKKGGMAKKDMVIAAKKGSLVGVGSSPKAAEMDYQKKMKIAGFSTATGKGGVAERGLGKASKGFKGGGMMLVIGIGKKKGK